MASEPTSTDPEVVRRREQTVALLSQAELVLHQAEDAHQALRSILADLRRKAETGRFDA